MIILPLYSIRPVVHVPEKSGLNQWNAAGRLRHADEVYIPIPKWIHKSFPLFFPGRDIKFILKLPNNTKAMYAKTCQDGQKALMSDPNRALGTWLLRDVLKLMPREILTYSKLRDAKFDSVAILKEHPGIYRIEIRPIGSYDKFKREYYK